MWDGWRNGWQTNFEVSENAAVCNALGDGESAICTGIGRVGYGKEYYAWDGWWQMDFETSENAAT